jgi:hypothetical protein
MLRPLCKLRAFTKELETMSAQKLLGAPNIGGSSARAGGDDGGSQRSPMRPSCPECTKTAKNGRFPALIDLKIAKKAMFYLKELNKIYSQDVF